MKTLVSILLASLIGISVSAHPGNKSDYLTTKDGKFVLAKVHFGLFKMHAKQVDGKELKVNYNEVKSYQKNGYLYEKKPLYYENKNTGSMVFMRLVSWRNGLGLYSYDEPSGCGTCTNQYFIFKDGDTFWLQVDSKNCQTVMGFFNRTCDK